MHKNYNLTKRVLDVIMAVTLLILLSPLLVVIAVAVRFDSRGPVLFRQKRLGKGQKCFTMYKFRSMIVGSRAVGYGECLSSRRRPHHPRRAFSEGVEP